MAAALTSFVEVIMEPIFLALGLVLLAANCILLILVIRRDSNRSVLTLLASMRDQQVNQGDIFRDELGRSRLESAGIEREHRQEIVTSFQSLSDIVCSRMAEFAQSQGSKLDVFSGQLRDTAVEIGRKLDSSREAVDEVLRSVAIDTRNLHTEFRTEITNAFAALAQTLDGRVGEGMRDQKAQLESNSSVLVQALGTSSRSGCEAIEHLRTGVEAKLTTIQGDNSTNSNSSGATLNKDCRRQQRTSQVRSSHCREQLMEAAEGLKNSVDGRLASIQTDNATQLQEMRNTIDEKLQSTLEQRHAGLGEMRTLASGVGDLKKVLMNIRARGNWGEVQIGNLLEQMLTPD